MRAAAQYRLADLLERAGARIRGRGRADCPRCQRPQAVSFDEAKAVYHCHGVGCDFSGGAARLARELGLARRLSLMEYRELRQNRERADKAARTLYERIKARRFELLDELHGLSRWEWQAHEAGPDHPATWGALALVCRRRPRVLAELAILAKCGAANLVPFLSAAAAERERALDAVILCGGLHDSAGRFVELAL